MSYNWGNRSKRRMEGVNPHLITCATRALARSKYDMTIPWMGGVRTADQQYNIFTAGNSNCDGINLKSNHQSGNALDVIPCTKLYPKKAYRQFANLMYEEWQKGLIAGEFEGYLEWGGLWINFVDKPHWQINK